MKKSLLVFIVTVLCLISLFFVYNHFNLSKTKKIYINNQLITVEIADNDKLRTKGLSGRIELGKNHGMLFIFPAYDIYNFWMKGMQFPLDFVWIKDDTVVDLTENVPFPRDPVNGPFDFYKPSLPVNKVLEINAGEIKRLDIKIGDKITYN